MTRRWLEATLALALVAAALSPSSAQQQPPQTTTPTLTLPSCPPAPLSLSPCIGYAFGAGSETLASCCDQIRGFMQAQAPCLCAASAVLAPSPVGFLLGQAQGIIPNVCGLPNPCDATAVAANSTDPAAPAAAPEAPGPAATPAIEASTAAGAPPVPADDEPPATAPAGTATKLPQLLHAAGASSSRGAAAGTVLVAVLLASVATVFA